MLNGISPQDENAFYIFLILNKNNNHHIEIFDIENNVIYENSDIDFIVSFDDNTTLNDFLVKARNLTKEHKVKMKFVTPKKTKKDNNYYESFNYFNNYDDNHYDDYDDDVKDIIGDK